MSTILQSLKQARILVIDDEPANVRLLTRLLDRAGYVNIVGTTSARDGMIRFSEETADLILLDLNMPDLEGFGVLEQLRGILPEHTYLPVLAITGLPTAEAKERALSLGAKDFLRKPFHPTEVLLRIHNLLETRSLYLLMDQRVRERTQPLEDAKLETLRDGGRRLRPCDCNDISPGSR